MNRHILRKHATRERLFCPICEKVLDGAMKLETHLKNHENKEIFHCLVCDAMLKTYFGLCTHVESVHKLEKHETTCTCDLCGVDYYSTKRLDTHMKTDHSGIYKCFEKTCSKRFSTLESLKRHFLLHHKQSVEVRLLKVLFFTFPLI